MAVRLMSLRSVPDDELDEICMLLDEHHISHYETPPSNWLISAGAIWLNDRDQLSQAHSLLNDYQHQRSQQARKEYAERRQKGEQEGVFDRLMQNPVQFIIYLAFIIFILYFSVKPFLDIGQ
ncbi:MAG: DUF6164 family protein [Pseudomonadota bacterium]|nr:DUF6164 family protein [Pseudomonadota bacterium]